MFYFGGLLFFGTASVNACDGALQVSVEIISALKLSDGEEEQLSRTIADLSDDARRRRNRGSSSDLSGIGGQVSRRGCRQLFSAMQFSISSVWAFVRSPVEFVPAVLAFPAECKHVRST